MKCLTCKFWQGNRVRWWADCYRVLVALQPELLGVSERDADGCVVRRLTIPFDPRDAQHWITDPYFRDLYKHLTMKSELPDGVRIVKDGNLFYFQTRKDFSCERYMEMSKSLEEYYCET